MLYEKFIIKILLPEATNVRSRLYLTLLAILSLMLVVGGCKHRRADRARSMEGGDKVEKIAPSDATTDGKEVAFSLVDKGGEDMSETEEIRRVYKLGLSTVVEISGINGSVDVETADTEIAEVLIVRSANNKDDLQFRRINIDHTPKRLRIRVENDRKSIFSEMGSFPEGRQRVMLKLPHSVEFRIDGLNGNLTAGGFDGKVEVNGVNGEIKIERATGEALFRGINGNIEVTIAKLADEGIRITGVNGNTKLRFTGDVNATVEMFGIHGEVETDLPNVKVERGESMFGSYKARVGNGGIRIRGDGVNGNIYLVKAGKDSAESPKAAAKTK
jgi:hypothetical protein